MQHELEELKNEIKSLKREIEEKDAELKGIPVQDSERRLDTGYDDQEAGKECPKSWKIR